MSRFGLGLVAALIALMPVGTALAGNPEQPAAAAQTTSFGGNWRHLAARAGSGRALKLVLVDSVQPEFGGGAPVARILVVDEGAVGGVRSNLLEFRFSCTERRATLLVAEDYDARHQRVPVAAAVQPGMTFDSARLWYAERARQFTCGELQAGAAAEGGAQAYADAYFQRIRAQCRANPNGPFCAEIAS